MAGRVIALTPAFLFLAVDSGPRSCAGTEEVAELCHAGPFLRSVLPTAAWHFRGTFWVLRAPADQHPARSRADPTVWRTQGSALQAGLLATKPVLASRGQAT